ncbi:MAG: hypothetical protein B6D36_13870 [Planctomycetes bacterium UTPLA1]|jgi:FkbM family methyltransferase|nr:MAG: hypothetical protein B6D36_13870 [Planctomycetes bacterium UTPLA1]
MSETPPTASNRPLAILVIVCLTVWLIRSGGGCDPALYEQSVRPGINADYAHPDIPTWMGRFESESREIYKARDEIVADCRVAEGDVVADIGAGTGLFTLLFARAVGQDGKVIAVDIVPEFLDLIQQRASDESITNVSTILCTERSAELPPNSIDLAFTSDTYHHFEYPRSTLASIYRALKPGGVFIVIDFERIEGKSRDWIISHVRAGRVTVIDEITSAGFVLEQPPAATYLAENYFLRFKKPSNPNK